MLSPHTATSRSGVRLYRTHAATGESAAVPSTAAGGNERRRRSAGAATPATSRLQAAALIPLRLRKGGQYRLARWRRLAAAGRPEAAGLRVECPALCEQSR